MGALLGGAPSFAQDVTLTLDEARAVARDAGIAGDTDLAIALTSSLLEANPGDAIAWLIRANALAQIDAFAEARAAAATAFRLLPPGPTRYEAARLAAIAANGEERLTLATWWLRRALIDAPNDAETERTLRDAALVSARNPLRTEVSLSFQPSDNVNGGVDDDFLTVDDILVSNDLSRDAQPLSGWVGTLAFSARYRLSSSEEQQSFIGLRGNFRGVLLSDAAQEELRADGRPTADRNYSYGSVEAYWRQDRAAEIGDWGIEVGAGARWVFGDWDETFVRLAYSRRLPLDETRQIRGYVWAESQFDLDDTPTDSRRVGAVASYTQVVPDVALVSTTLAYARTFSDSSNRESQTWTLAVAAQPAEPIGPARVLLRAGYQISDYPLYNIDLDPLTDPGRFDSTLFANVDLSFPDISFAGFEPVVTLNASRTTSNINRFEVDSAGIGLTFQSSF